jgi:hypothetical protein
MVNCQSRTGIFLQSSEGNVCPDLPGSTHRKQNVTNLNQKLSITFTKIPGKDDTALILEVVAGEIRRGKVSGDETEFSWTMGPP